MYIGTKCLILRCVFFPRATQSFSPFPCRIYGGIRKLPRNCPKIDTSHPPRINAFSAASHIGKAFNINLR